MPSHAIMTMLPHRRVADTCAFDLPTDSRLQTHPCEQRYYLWQEQGTHTVRILKERSRSTHVSTTMKLVEEVGSSQRR